MTDHRDRRSAGTEHAGSEAPSDGSTVAPLGEQAGDQIGRYKLLQEIGVGGMGSVWMAQQSEPVRRKVALKIIKLGMDTHEVVVRFEAERQALALMNHPHIAKVFDGGATQNGRPYFVMELVDGTPITEYCDAARTGLRERLELFVKVCEAVQHAHQKGVIHRDIKPGNVLVTLHDGVPVPKVIDFGIAKATSAELTHKTLFTKHAQMLGTPEYMAPEQAERSGLDVDTRADVYSLGVLLYELLTGSRPFDITKALEKGYDEFLRTIREDDPMRPSTRVSTAAAASPVAVGRQVNVEALSKRLRGDLDWVVMKALEKDRTRRYETANGFAADVGRYLRDEPVVAAPPSAAYRLRKFVRRRKKTVAAVGTTAFVLVAGSIGTGLGWWKTKRANEALEVAIAEKDEAIVEKDAALAEEALQRSLAESNEARAVEAEADAVARADELEEVARFQSAQLGELDPEVMGARLRRSILDAAPDERREALTANLAGLNFTNLALQSLEENVFARTIDAIDEQFEEQPLVRARLLFAAARTMRALGLVEAAGDPGERALSLRRAELANDDPALLASIEDRGRQLIAEGRLADAEPYHLEALEGWRRSYGDEHRDSLISLGNLGALYLRQARYAEAEPLIREAVEGLRRLLGDEDRVTLTQRSNLANVILKSGRLDEAVPHYLELLEIRRRTLRADHPDIVTAVSHVGGVYFSLGQYEKAEAFFRESYEARRRLLGDDHPKTLVSLGNLGAVLQALKRYDEAESCVRQELERTRRVLGPEHPEALNAVTRLAQLLMALKRFDDAEEFVVRALEAKQRTLGPDHPNTIEALNDIGFLYCSQGRSEEGEQYFRDALAARRRVLGDDHPDTLMSLHNVGVGYLEAGDLERAESLIRTAVEGRSRVIGAEHPKTRNSLTRLVSVYEQLVAAAREAGDAQELGRLLVRSGSYRLRLGEFAEVERELREGLELLEAEGAERGARYRQATSELGAALAAQGRADEAEPLLRRSAEWALAAPRAESTAPDVAREIVERLIEHLEEDAAVDGIPGDASAPTEAERWRARLDEWAQDA